MPVELASGVVVAGRYRLERALGQGGMGVVWAAMHMVTRKRVALKFLRGPVHLRPELRRRFLREARAASAVVHPNVLEVHDVFELDDQTPVMLMDLLDGETLGARIVREGKLSLPDTADILIQVVSAVGTAHAVGVVHRDLKPDNVFLLESRNGPPSVRVLDFGIAKLVGAEGPTAETGIITGTGSMLGTPCYMSPEQSFGEKAVDYRTDIWSLGVILYECLTGARPVEGDSIGQVVKRLVTDGITPISVALPSLSTDVSALIDSMLAREREHRPQDLREVSSILLRHTAVRVPDFGPATTESVAEEGASSNPIVRDSSDTTPSAEVPMGPETAGAHTVSQVHTSGRVSRALWGAAAIVVLGGSGAVVARLPSISNASSSTPAAPSIAMAPSGAISPIGTSTASPQVVGASPASTGSVELPATPETAVAAAASAGSAGRTQPLGAPVARTPLRPVREAAPRPATAGSVPSAAPQLAPPSTPAPRPQVGGLAEKPPF